MRILCGPLSLGAPEPRSTRCQIFRPDPFLDPSARIGCGARCDPCRVGPHIGDEARWSISTQLDSLVGLLCDPHPLSCGGAEALRRRLLPAWGSARRWRLL